MTWSERFIAHLEQAAEEDDRAALAALRRSLDEETASFARAAPHVAPYLPGGLDPSSERVAYLVAGLFALQPSSGRRTFARALREVMERRDSASIEGRFVALLGADLEDLASHLRHAVALIRGEELGLDWVQLLEDLCRWSHPNGFVQRRWASDFWASNEPVTPNANTETNTETKTETKTEAVQNTQNTKSTKEIR